MSLARSTQRAKISSAFHLCSNLCEIGRLCGQRDHLSSLFHRPSLVSGLSDCHPLAPVLPQFCPEALWLPLKPLAFALVSREILSGKVGLGGGNDWPGLDFG